MQQAQRSLRTRLAAGVLCAVVLSLWLVALAIDRELRRDMEATISAQQFSTVALLAAEIERSLSERIDLLESVAGRVATDPLATSGAVRELAGIAPALLHAFNWGVFVTDEHGRELLGVPVARSHPGLDHSNSPGVREALASGSMFVTEPIAAPIDGAMVFHVAIPVRDKEGRTTGVIVGVTNLERPNFLDEISTAKYGLTGDFLLTGPRSRICIASSDKRRVLRAGPPPGVNPMYDSYIAGREGSGVAVSSRGIEELTSSVRVPSTGWLVQAVLPTKEAFAPVAALQHRIAIVSVLVALLAGAFALWWLRRQLSPLREASVLLEQMRNGARPRQPLPVRHQDEIGQMAIAFNGLLETIVEREALAAQDAANRHMHKILRQVPGMVFQYQLDADGTGHFQFVSQAVEAIYGITADALVQDAGVIRSIMLPEDHERLFGSLRQSAESMAHWKTDYRIVRPGGDIRWLHVDAVPEKADDEQITWFGFVTDVTGTKAMESELRVAAATFESQEGILITDATGTILRVNRAFTRITGYPESDVVGRRPSVLSSGRHDEAFYQQLWQTLLRDGVWSGEIWNRRRNGDIFAEWVTISAVRDADGKTSHYVASFTDVTERKETEQRIHHLAFFDPLTNLPNRRLLIDRIRQALAASQRNRQHGAVLFLDLDRFKILNDTRGHDIGDRLLVEVARRLKAGLREDDTVARLGGDEFVVLLQNLGQQAGSAAGTARLVADKIRQALNAPYDLGGHRHLSSSSIGVTLFLGEEQGVDILLKQADVALYEAKAAGRNTARFFDPQMQEDIEARAELESGLREAIGTDALQLHYQPQVDLNGRPIGAEALLRWFPPSGAAISPDRFIPLAGETNLILPLGEWVVRSACHTLQAWATQPELADLVLSINISARQFSQHDFIGQMEEMLDLHDIRPGRLMLELTESAVLHNVDDAIARMKHLKERGVMFALDDFGTGYSSLSHLKRLPVDQLKIDQAFVRDVGVDPEDAAIVRTIVALGRMFGVSVMAEGVETPEQRAFLQACQCEAYQGYLFGRPTRRTDFENFIHTRVVAPAAK